MLHRASHVGGALGFEGDVHKSGYLVKRAKKSGANWKKRYFVLNGSSLIYYESHKKTNSAKGNLLITVDFVIKDVVEPKYPFCFEIETAFEKLRVAGESAEEVAQWKEALHLAVSRLDGTTRGFLQLQVSSMFRGKQSWVKKFFVLHANALTYHNNHFDTHKNLGSIKLSSRTSVAKQATTLTIKTGSQQLVVACVDVPEAQVWYDAIVRTVKRVESLDDLAGKIGTENTEVVLLDGHLGTATEAAATLSTRDALRRRTSVVGASTSDHFWPAKFYALTSTALYQADNANATEAQRVFLVSPTCAVFETTLKPYAFELVTSQGVLHVHASSEEDRDRWTEALRDAISSSSRLVSDPLHDAVLHMDLNLYECNFETKQPLGIVLERSAEWAIVKSSKREFADVSPGSALVAINGSSTQLEAYASVIQRLTGWQPPLKLTFARSPTLSGWLGKRARGRSGRSSKRNWKRRFFELKEGKLAYYDKDATGQSAQVREGCLKGALLLMGCAVALAPKGPETDDQPFCIRLVSGIGVLVMQAETLEECLKWATTLYHGIAIANGGGYLLDVERQKHALVREEEEPVDAKLSPPPPPAEEEEKKESEAAAEQPPAELPPSEPVVEKKEETGSDKEQPPPVDIPPSAPVFEEENEQVASQSPPPPLNSAEIPRAEAEFAPPLHDRRRQSFSAVVASKEAVLPVYTNPKSDDHISDVDEEDEEEDDDEEEDVPNDIAENEDAPEVGDGGGTLLPAIGVEEDEMEVIHTLCQVHKNHVPLTDEELETTFDLLKGSNKGWLNPMQFVSLLRRVGLSDEGNLQWELQLFHEFDTKNEGHLTKEDFVRGMHRHMSQQELESNAAMRHIVVGIRNFSAQGTVEL
ncbi:hypothetical protein CTAYLR_001549 [Chrysophaeum taylorii]|uniref:Uncharacterized protein n=1 Tax=Chrysophaeum taylorii TaxID=2483200 RepID=A0AAD7XKJ4_9STRA|nr:hypothetical protein CTAYLR_001549 [Chrysophaeum taylorii]